MWPLIISLALYVFSYLQIKHIQYYCVYNIIKHEKKCKRTILKITKVNCDLSIFIKYLLLFKSCLVLAYYEQLFEGLANTRINLLLHSIFKGSCSLDVIISFRVLNFDVHECLVGFSCEYYVHA